MISGEYEGGFHRGDKCPCLQPQFPDGSGREFADHDCDLCWGTGRVGMLPEEMEHTWGDE